MTGHYKPINLNVNCACLFLPIMTIFDAFFLTSFCAISGLMFPQSYCICEFSVDLAGVNAALPKGTSLCLV